MNLPLGCTSGCTLYDNAGLNNQFIMIPSGTNYPANAQDTTKRGQPLQFNDVLVYLTIDEVMHYAEKRVASEMAKALKTFTTDATTTFTKYPWLQPLSASYADSTSLYSLQNTTFGTFPFMVNNVNAQYRTDFSWVLTGSTESTFWNAAVTPPVCFRIGTGPNRWVRNPLISTLNSSTAYGGPFANGAAPVGSGTCTWLGGTSVNCKYDAGTMSKSFVPYSSQGNCNSLSSPLASITLSVARTVTLIQDTTDCATAPVRTYSAATGANVHRWSWNCNNTSFGVLEVTDTISNASYNQLPTIARLTSGGPSQTFALNNMRYNPIMPAWFFHNRWYSTAFASWAPGSTNLPTTPSPNPCNPVTNLTVRGGSANTGGATVNTGVLILAGPARAGQTRPSAAISNYLDGTNTSAGTTCILNKSDSATSSNLNDNMLVLP